MMFPTMCSGKFSKVFLKQILWQVTLCTSLIFFKKTAITCTIMTGPPFEYNNGLITENKLFNQFSTASI